MKFQHFIIIIKEVQKTTSKINLSHKHKMNTELWMTVPNYENYEASNLGNVRNKKTGRILKPSMTKSGYMILSLRKENKTKCFNLHSIIALTWVDNDNPKINTEVHHIDHNKSNNRADNLKWVSRAENIYYGTNDITVCSNYLSKEITKLMNKYGHGLDLRKTSEEILMFVEDTLLTNRVGGGITVEYR